MTEGLRKALQTVDQERIKLEACIASLEHIALSALIDADRKAAKAGRHGSEEYLRELAAQIGLEIIE